MRSTWIPVRSLALITAGAVLATLGAGAGSRSRVFRDGPLPPLDEIRRELQDLRKKYEEVRRGSEESSQQVSWLSRTSPPVGTVMAFAGEWPPARGEGGRWTEEELGWLLCDGRELKSATYTELRASLGRETLPDYRGYFLRGIDVSIDGKTTSGRDVDGIRPVGGQQGFATAKPTAEKPFVTDDPGDHDHLIPSWVTNDGGGFEIGIGGYAKYDYISAAPTDKKGHHTHKITGGGDAETRPINIAVYWIVKFK